MFFILNNEALNYLLNLNFFNEEIICSYDNIFGLVINYEIRLTQIILKNNWNINSIINIFKNIDYVNQTEYISYFGPPYAKEEIIFYKDWNNR